MEDRLEEERIMRERRELEQVEQREANKRKRKVQDTQAANAQVVMEPRRKRNIVDAHDLPPPRPPSLNPTESHQPPSSPYHPSNTFPPTGYTPAQFPPLNGRSGSRLGSSDQFGRNIHHNSLAAGHIIRETLKHT